MIGNNGSGKTSLIEATIREYYNLNDIPKQNVLVINNLKDQGIQYYRNEVKIFSQTRSNIPLKNHNIKCLWQLHCQSHPQRLEQSYSFETSIIMRFSISKLNSSEQFQG